MTYVIRCLRCGEWFPDHYIYPDEPMHVCRPGLLAAIESPTVQFPLTREEFIEAMGKIRP